MKHAPIILLLTASSAALLSAGCTALPSDLPPLRTLPKSAPIQPANPYSFYCLQARRTAHSAPAPQTGAS